MKTTLFTIAIAIAIIIVLSIAVWTIVAFIRKKKAKKNAQTAPTTPTTPTTPVPNKRKLEKELRKLQAEKANKKGEKITHVTKRLLDKHGIRMSYTGTLESGFYLGAICNFELKGTPYDSFGEFDAGVGSGWMITLNKTFIK